MSNRRVLLKLGPKSKDLKEYDIEDYEKKELIHSVIFELQKKNLIRFEWESFNKGNIIASVWLNLDQLESAYAFAGKAPKSKVVNMILDRITEIKCNLEDLQNIGKTNGNLPWIIHGIKDVQNGIKSKKQLSPFLPDSIELSFAILIAIHELCLITENELLERVFSLRCYGDSKYFEKNVRSRLVSFIKKYNLLEFDNEDNLTDEEILRSAGISKNPEIIEFCGSISIIINGAKIDFRTMSKGAAINSDTVRLITRIDIEKIQKVIFTENRSNFSYYISRGILDNELVIYHGGFYSPARRKFFELIYQFANPETDFYHWGDIDLGGVSIFLRLKKEIIPQLKPYNMSADTLKEMKQYAKGYSTEYRKKLEKALDDARFKEFYDSIVCMLELGIRLEQEAFLLL